MATFDINAFKSEMWNNGVVRPHSYYAFFGIPKALFDARDPAFKNTRHLSMRCESASLPDVTLATQEVLRYGYGPMESVPYTAVFTGVTMTFVLDRTSRVYKFFYSWMNTIVNFNTSKGMATTNPQRLQAADTVMTAYDVGYKDNVTTDIVISIQDEFARPIIQNTLYKAYPRAINAVDLNWGNNNDVVRLTIPFAFRDFSSEMIKQPQPLMDSPLSADVASGKAPPRGAPVETYDKILGDLKSSKNLT